MLYKYAIEILKKLEDNSHQAYIVGGFVRDKLLDKDSNDIDICTSATPKEIMEIFDISTASESQYGAVRVLYKNYTYDVTTFRQEFKYEDNRKPIKIKYIKDIKKDLLRRDFTINTFCINSGEEILDFLNVRSDLDNKIIKTVGNPRYRIKEDSLRILRAIRFSAILNFNIENKTKYYIMKYAKLLTNLSFQRKKEELNKIFLSSNKELGVSLILELKLDKYLNLDKLSSVKLCNDVIGIWSQLEVDDLYPFTKLEKEQMKLIRKLLDEDNLNPYILYKYELYPNSVCADIKNINKKEVTKIYNELPIHSRKDIVIKEVEIANILYRKPGKYLKEIMDDIELKIIYNKLENDKDKIIDYIKKNY